MTADSPPNDVWLAYNLLWAVFKGCPAVTRPTDLKYAGCALHVLDAQAGPYTGGGAQVAYQLLYRLCE